MRSRRAALGLVGAMLVAAWGLTSCSSSSPAPSGSDNFTIKLARNPWDASRINVAIAQTLLTEQLHANVEVTDIDEFKQWDAIASGDLHASLEVWPSGHKAELVRFVDTGLVENGGDLGPVGKIGWYIPSYMLTQHPELSTWEGLKQPSAVDLFKTPDTEPLGRFLSGDPTWTQYDSDIIRNLNLSFKVVWAGSERAELDELAGAYARRAPILMYMWTPHSVLSKYDMTSVELPPYDDACYAQAASHGIACAYPADQLFKIFWPELAQKAPRAYRFLAAFRYTTRDQISLLAKVNNEGFTIDQAARAWIDQNVALWQTWFSK
jgi:glycine betaine/proline transport system substrate-binding protein